MTTTTNEELDQITGRLRTYFHTLAPEAAEEAVQDCTCSAWRMLESARAAGKDNVKAGNVAYYAMRQYRAGRCFQCGTVDGQRPAAALRVRNALDMSQVGIDWSSGIAAASWPVFEQASLAIDFWSMFVGRQTEPMRRAIRMRAEGRTFRECAAAIGIGLHTFHWRMKTLAAEFRALCSWRSGMTKPKPANWRNDT